MTDSDGDFMSNDIELNNGEPGMHNYTQSLNHSNLTSRAFHSNMIASNYNIQNKYMSFGQQSIFSRRETSPMSLRSLPSSRMQSQNSYRHSQVNCQGSVYNERFNERSPMSLRSVASNASVSAANIVLALNNTYLNKYELRMIKDACNSLMSSRRCRRKVGKRRNLKSILKCCTRKSGGESGVEGSDSSRSSDDCRSTRSTFYKEKFPVTKTRPILANYNKYTTQSSVNDIYEDRSENFKQNSLRNLLLANNRTGNHRSNNKQHFTHDRHINVHQKMTHNHMYSEINQKENVSENDKSILNAPHKLNDKVQNESAVTLKERFTQSSFLLPSQRFSKPTTQSTTYELSFKEKSQKIQSQESSDKKNKIYEEKTKTDKQTEPANESENEDYEILSRNTGIVNTTHSHLIQCKRIHVTEDVTYPENKKNKLTAQIPNHRPSSEIVNLKNANEDDCNFKKPRMPIRKYNFLKRSLNTDSEILIAKSSQPLVGVVSQETMNMPQMNINLERTHNGQETNKLCLTAIDTVNDISMTDTVQDSSIISKPSFTKRKLFTQSLDIVDSNNLSDHLNGNSPQPRPLRACREKNKVRKLVTSQSCLRHDVVKDNNVIDLIHKIVPPHQINVTSAFNKQEASKCSHEDEDKWDVTSVISKCKMDDASDTFSDEEILIPQEVNKRNTNGHKANGKEAEHLKHSITKDSSCTKNKHTNVQCKVVIEKLSDNKVQRKSRKVGPIQSFWDIDLSDVDDNVDSPLKKKSQHEPRRKKVGHVKSFWNTDLPDVNDHVRSTLKIKSPEEQRPKKVGLAKSFWDTDLSDVDDYVDSPLKIKSQQEQTQRHCLRNSTKIISTHNNRTWNNINTENSVNGTINSNAKRRKSTENINTTRINRSQIKHKEDEQNSKNSKKDAKHVNKENKNNAKPSSNKKKKTEDSPNDLNSSRKSLRIKLLKNKNICNNLTPDSDNCNTSRESIRLKLKRQQSNIKALNMK